MNQEQLTQIQKLLTGFLSQDASRVKAEKIIEQNFDNVQGAREAFIVGLMKLLRACPEDKIRTLCAILLRKKLPNGEPVLFDKLSVPLQTAIKTELLQALAHEPDRYVRSQISDTVADLAEVLLYKSAWDELIPFLVKLSTQSPPELRITGLSIFGKLFDHSVDTLEEKNQVTVIRQIFAGNCGHEHVKVREEAVFGACKALIALEDDADRKEFHAFIPHMLKILSDLLSKKDERGAARLLAALVDVATVGATFFRPNIDNVAKAMFAIGKTAQLDDGPRQLSLEFLTATCECSAGMVRRHLPVLQAAVNLSMSLMLCIEEDPTWCQRPEPTEDRDDSTFVCGEESIDRIAASIGGKKIVPILFPLISEFMTKEDWKFRHAGLKALAQAGEVAKLPQIPVLDVVKYIKDPHPRVRYAATACLGQLCDDFGPDIQTKFHKAIVPGLVFALNDGQNPRIQSSAASSLANFFSHADKATHEETVNPYVETLLQILLVLLKKGVKIVQEQVLTAIAAVAGASPDLFKKYYGGFVPMIKQILVQAKDHNMANLRSRAMEAITFIGMAVGKEVFRQDAKEVVNIFIEIMKTGRAEDDISQQYMLQAWTRLASVLGAEFVPCLPYVIPHVFTAAQKQADYSLLQKEGDEPLSPGEQRQGSRAFTESLQDKAIACSMICSFLTDLKEHFFPYLDDAAKIMIPLMGYYLNDNVRHHAISCMPDMLQAAVTTMEAGKTDLAYVKKLFGAITEKLLECFKTEIDTELLMTLVGTMQMCIQNAEHIARELLDEKALTVVGQALLKLLTKSHERIQNREGKRKSEDFDEEMEEKIAKDNEYEDELNFMVSECIGALMQSHKEQFLPTWNIILPEINRMLQPSSFWRTRKIALFIIDDVVENLNVASAPYFQGFMKAFFAYVGDDNVEVRQAAAYGLAVSAQYCKQLFQPFADDAAKKLIALIQKEGSRQDEDASATDNIITALGKIACYQNRPQLLSHWLGFLPITDDSSEAPWNYGQLCILLEANNPALIGKNFANLPKIMSVIAEVLTTENYRDMLDEALASRLLANLKRIQGSVPSEVMAKVLEAMPPRHRAQVQQALK